MEPIIGRICAQSNRQMGPTMIAKPLFQGTYFIRNLTFDAELVTKVYPDADKYSWLVEIQNYDEDGELNICVTTSLGFLHAVRKGNKSLT